MQSTWQRLAGLLTIKFDKHVESQITHDNSNQINQVPAGHQLTEEKNVDNEDHGNHLQATDHPTININQESNSEP